MNRMLLLCVCVFSMACGDSPTVVPAPTDTGAAGGDVTEPVDWGSGTNGVEIVEDVGSAPDTQEEDATTGAPEIEEPPCDCDDGNDCTQDICNPDKSCTHKLLLKSECAPWVKLDAPQRGATLVYSGGTVGVSGEAGSAYGPTASLTLNQAAVQQGEGAAFSATVAPTHGINTLKAKVFDSAGASARHLQSFVMAESYYPTTQGPTADALISNGIVAWLGQDVWDDNDLSDLDDMATLAHMILEGLDIVSLIPSPITNKEDEPGLLWCKWSVTIKKVTYAVDYVDLTPVIGGLKLKGQLSQLEIDFEAIAPAIACPDAIGTATSKSVLIDAEISVSMAPGGPLLVKLKSVAVKVDKAKFTFTNTAGKAFGWLANLFSGTVAGYVEDAVENAINEQVVPLVTQLITKLANFEQSVEIPPLPYIEKGITVTVQASPSHVDFSKDGAIVGLRISATAPQAYSWLSSMGSIARGGCLVNNHKNLAMPAAPMVIALHDDLLNQALFAAWWGGLANISIGEEFLAGLVPDFPVTDMSIQVDPWMPPVLTSCNSALGTQLQAGDIRLLITFSLNGAPSTIEVFANAVFTVSLDATAGENGSLNLNLSIDTVVDIDFHMVDITGAIDGSEAFIATLLEDVLGDMVIQAFTGGFMQSFPIPKLDIGGFVPGIAEGTFLSLKPTKIERQNAYLIITGKISD